ncbi:DUF1259 domain-containing protein [Bacillus subtilis]|uniref:DUF1259 domain-containing protein n=1 Tax=Bacillus subtilis TaxID=1423 RepID=UPI00162600CF
MSLSFLHEEVNSLLTELGCGVTALHNHWLFSEPCAMYMHFESAQDSPITFARKAAAAFGVL